MHDLCRTGQGETRFRDVTCRGSTFTIQPSQDYCICSSHFPLDDVIKLHSDAFEKRIYLQLVSFSHQAL